MRQTKLTGARVLVFGDVMLDEYVTGSVKRVSPEAPIPVLLRSDRHFSPGGAANVAANVAGLGGRAYLVGLTGDDRVADDLDRVLSVSASPVETRLVRIPNYRTTIKTRFTATGQQLLRVDSEQVLAVSETIAARLVASALDALSAVDVVIFSDYAKGVICEETYAPLVDAAKRQGKVVVVDPKRSDLRFYRGANYLTPNRKELAEAVDLPAESDRELEIACRAAQALCGAGLLVTRSERGMSLAELDEPLKHVRATAQEVFDVSGAGDTAVATFGSALAVGFSGEEAMHLANAAAGIAVGKRGTTVITAAELSGYFIIEGDPHMGGPRGLSPLDLVLARRRLWGEHSLRVGFTNGCFDILHAGHTKILEEAAKRCDRLVVGINSDASVRRLKGNSRPVNSAEARGAVLAALRSVDAVVVFDEDTPANLISALKPDLLVKGGDYTREQVVGAAEVEHNGGEVMLVDFLEGFSTTSILRRAADRRA